MKVSQTRSIFTKRKKQIARNQETACLGAWPERGSVLIISCAVGKSEGVVRNSE